jgi:hypothetical protein
MAIRAEATAGTYLAPTTNEHNIRFRNIEYTINTENDDDNSKYANGHHGEDESIPGMRSVTITASFRMTYGGAVATVPNWWQAAYACGLEGIGWDSGSAVAIGSAVEGISLVPRESKDDTTYSICIYEEEIGSSPVITELQAAGCMGNMVMTAENIGGDWIANVTFTGKLNDIVDGSAVALTSPQTQIGEKMLSNTFTIGGNAACISSFTLDLGNEITPVLCQSEATGISHYVITARRPRFSCNPLSKKQATDDWLNVWDSATTQVISNASTNYTMKIIDAQLLSFGMSPREGLNAWELMFKCLQNGSPGSLTDSALTNEDTFDILQGARS